MHNNIMEVGSRDRPPMLAIRRYAQWRSRFLRYIDTRPNGDALRKCILEGPYTPTTVVVPAVPATDDSSVVLKHTTVETPMNMSPENKAHYQSKKEVIHLILTEIRDEIYSTVDACIIAQEINENVDNTLRYKNDNQSGQFGSQRMVNVGGARENECRKPKRVKDSTYHKEKMLLCKQAEKETDDSNVIPDSPDTCDNDIQNDQIDVECDDERAVLANLIANLILDVDENKKIQKKLKKANTSLALELEQCKSILAETSKTLEESSSVQDSCLVKL
nr:hypothetical protein [Tanacetum cinerariifolium]GEY46630.1 hypothetical protein [Tanacetum cinerariifolium]